MAPHRQVLEDTTRGTDHWLTCTKCSVATRHRVIASRNVRTSAEDLDIEDDYEIVECQGCWTLGFRHFHRNRNIIDTYIEYDPISSLPVSSLDAFHEEARLYPPRSARRKILHSPECIPFLIRDIYEETVSALDRGNARLPALGIRNCLEVICLVRGIEGRDLEKRINALVAAGSVTADDAVLLHRIRESGNVAAHELIAPPQEAVDAAMGVLESLLHRLFELPFSARPLPPSRSE